MEHFPLILTATCVVHIYLGTVLEKLKERVDSSTEYGSWVEQFSARFERVRVLSFVGLGVGILWAAQDYLL